MGLVTAVLALRDEPSFRYRHHCFEQELLNMYVVRRAAPRWLNFPQLLELEGARGPKSNVTALLRLRFLNFSRWPGVVRPARLVHKNQSIRITPATDTCIFHSVADARLKAEKAWAERGLWHLPPDQPASPRTLDCSGPPARVSELFTSDNLEWRARDVIDAVEDVRARMSPVRFYLYDAPLLPESIEGQLERLDACGANTKKYQYGGEYFFSARLWHINGA